MSATINGVETITSVPHDDIIATVRNDRIIAAEPDKCFRRSRASERVA